VSWKTQLQLLDMEGDERIEARCCTCGYVWYERPAYHQHKSHMRQLFLDEFEARLRCKQWNCKGKIKIALTSEDETEGFQGGLA
jgi:hypothetical protein